ncbi:MAG: spore coat U domain-containing protein [Steroidobacteraceae bacterium]
MRRASPACALLMLLPAMSQAAVSCSTSATGPSFGVYNPLSSTATPANGSISVTCSLTSGNSATVPVTVAFSTGYSGTYSSRYMLSGTNRLSYNLYKDSAYTLIYGDGTGGSYTAAANPSFELTRSNPSQTASGVIYGLIGAKQDVAPGSYSDTIVVTISY